MSDLNNTIADLNAYIRELEDLKAKIKLIGWNNGHAYCYLSAEDDVRSAVMHLNMALRVLLSNEEEV